MQNLTWTRKGSKNLLISDGNVLVTLNIKSTTGADFLLNDREYIISTKGAWNPVCYVTSNGLEILKLTHGFWTSKGKIIFNDGSIYDTEYISKAGIKLRFSNAGNEILSYAVAFENKRAVLHFAIGIEMIDADKLLILAALGMTMFSGIFMEIAGDNDTTTAAFLTTIS